MGLRRRADGQIVGSHQNDVILLRKFQVLVRHVESMFDRGNTRRRGIVRAGFRPTVSDQFQACFCRFIDHKLDIFDRVDVTLIVNDDLDHARPVMDILADTFDHFVARVCKKVFRFGQFLFVGLKVKLPSVRCDNASRIYHRRPGNLALLDRSPNARASVIAFVADIANAGKPAFQHRPCIYHALDRAIRIRVEQRRKVVVSMVPRFYNVHAKVGMHVE